MSKIEEIRKRHEDRTQQLARLGPIAQYEATAEQAHQDRATLLAALDGEWQSGRPEPGRWHVSCRPEIRGGADAVVEVEVFPSGLVFDRSGKGEPLDHPMFTGALWQRRTVPRDPFKGGGV